MCEFLKGIDDNDRQEIAILQRNLHNYRATILSLTGLLNEYMDSKNDALLRSALDKCMAVTLSE